MREKARSKTDAKKLIQEEERAKGISKKQSRLAATEKEIQAVDSDANIETFYNYCIQTISLFYMVI